MKVLFSTIRWDLCLLLKYQIITVAAIITLFYVSVVLFFPVEIPEKIVLYIIFTDPTMIGFIFIGAMVLFEKTANTLEVLSITPMKVWQYLLSKAIALTLVALVSGLIMAFAAFQTDFNIIYMVVAISFSSVMLIFIGFIGVSRIKTLNQYILIIPIFLLPVALPILDFLDIVTSPLFYLIPTQASLILFEASRNEVSILNQVYSITYLLAWVIFTFYLARNHFIVYIKKGKE